MHIVQVIVGYTCTCARADVPPFLYPGNGWADCAGTYYVVETHLPGSVKGGTQLHMRTPFSYLGNSWTDCAEICMRLETH